MTYSPGHRFADDAAVMQYAIDLARQGFGNVEPNPPVGAVVVDSERRLIADGYHQKFGEAHAEVNAIANCAGNTQGHQLFVTLEPCSHHGKTPPCAEAVIAAGFSRAVIGCEDPAPHTSLNGIRKLKDAGIEVDVGVCQNDSEELIAPFTMLQLQQRPWVHAKWAMTLDGKIASRTGHSKWISNEESRAEVHRLRGRMEAIITGAGTVRADDPLLTARPKGPKTAARIVVESSGTSVSLNSQLVQSLDDAPVILCVREKSIATEHCRELERSGVELIVTQGNQQDQLQTLLKELGQRRMTHVLVEAGGVLIGQFHDSQLIDEVHAFIAAKIVGSENARTPVAGEGLAQIPGTDSLKGINIKTMGTNVLIEGRIKRGDEAQPC